MKTVRQYYMRSRSLKKTRIVADNNKRKGERKVEVTDLIITKLLVINIGKDRVVKVSTRPSGYSIRGNRD